MTNEELKKYYNAQKLQGRSESQIARSLGMSLTHFMGRLNGVDVDKVGPPKPKKEEAKKLKEKDWSNKVVAEKLDIPEKPVVKEVKEEPKSAEDLSWMDD